MDEEFEEPLLGDGRRARLRADDLLLNIGCFARLAPARADRLPELLPEPRLLDAQSVHHHVKVFAPLDSVAHGADEWQDLLDRLRLLRGVAKASPRERVFEHELYVWNRLPPTPVVLLDALRAYELVRVCAVGKDEDFDLEILRQQNLDCALRRVHTGAVTIIIDDHFARKPAQ